MRRLTLFLICVFNLRIAVADTGIGISAAGKLTSLPPSAPTLMSPANEAIDKPLKNAFSWKKTVHTSSYKVQVSPKTDFSELTLNREGLTDTVLTVEVPANATHYYWRVCSQNRAGAGSFSTVWSFTTVPAVPAAPAILSPADGAENIAVNPSVSWSASERAVSYQLQVSTQSNFAGLVLDKSDITQTSYALSGLSNQTKYYWRVRAKNTGGFGDWSTISSFITIVAAPQWPALISPADSAQNVPLTVQLGWRSVTLATAYHVQVSKDNKFSTTLVNQKDIKDTTYAVQGLTNLVQYYWRVRAQNLGGYSDWSTARSFITVIALPAIPVLVTPADSSENVDVKTALVWSKAERAATYRLQLSIRSDFSTLLEDKTELADTTFTPTALSHLTRYFWRVASLNASGSSDWSPVGSFTTRVAAPAAPALIAPADKLTKVPLSPTLVWNTMALARSYRLQVGKNADLSAPLIDKKDLTDTLFVLSSLEYSAVYYWRVAAINTTGSSDFSTTWSFKTVPRALAAPIPIYPSHDAKLSTVDIELQWHAVDRARNYHVQVTTAADFSTLVHDKSMIADTTLLVSGLNHSQIYYWRVAAVNDDGEGPFSSSRSFTTGSLGVDNLAQSTPTSFALLPNYPNPFNPETTITFQIPANQNQTVRLNVYNSSGQFIANLFNGTLTAGTYTVKWNGKNQAGEHVGTGVYLYRLETANYCRSAKMLYIR